MHIKKFSHYTAVEQLLQIDARVFNPETFFPWYTQKNAITAISVSWLGIILISWLLLAFSIGLNWWIGLLIICVSSAVFAASYYWFIQTALSAAKSKTMKQIMHMEKHGLMKALMPFVDSDLQTTARRITVEQVFQPNEYASIVVGIQARVLLNTKACSLKVPESAKRRYQNDQQNGTFNDVFFRS